MRTLSDANALFIVVGIAPIPARGPLAVVHHGRGESESEIRALCDEVRALSRHLSSAHGTDAQEEIGSGTIFILQLKKQQGQQSTCQPPIFQRPPQSPSPSSTKVAGRANAERLMKAIPEKPELLSALRRKHIVSVNHFDTELILQLFRVAASYETGACS